MTKKRVMRERSDGLLVGRDNHEVYIPRSDVNKILGLAILIGIAIGYLFGVIL